MVVSDHRMVAGQPIHYYHYFKPSPNYYPSYFPSQFDYYYNRMDVGDEIMMPPSPNSTQVVKSVH